MGTNEHNLNNNNRRNLTMLKIVKTSLVIAASTLAFSNAAQANDINEALANICTIVQADDKGELRKKMRSVQSDYKLKLRDYYSGISCNGQSLIRTALLNKKQKEDKEER